MDANLVEVAKVSFKKTIKINTKCVQLVHTKKPHAINNPYMAKHQWNMMMYVGSTD